MESVIRKIIEIDGRAQDKLRTAENDKADELQRSQDECRNLEQKLRQDADARIAEIEQINKSEFENLSQQLTEKYAAEIKNMDAFYEAEHEKTENEIFAEIVGEED
ncbi:MAG: hypothetical protein ACI4JB_03795 [Porcipelethomonas sp.]